MRKPLITVAYITKQAEDFLWYSMKSVYDYCDEIVVVDDMSTDSTIDIVKSFPEKKVLLFRDNFNRDKRRQRNTYLAKASGTFIHIVDDDEVYSERQLDWLRKFIQSPEAINVNGIFFHILWFWKEFNKVIHGHHWDQHFETFYRRLPGLRYEAHHYVSWNGQPLCKHPSCIKTDKVTIYHYSHCKPPEKIREKIRYYMLRDNPNVTQKNVDKYVDSHPYFSGNFNQPRYGPGGLQIAGTVGSQRDQVVEYKGEHPEVMKGNPLVMKSGKMSMEEYKVGMNRYMTEVWRFHNHLNHERHQWRLKQTAEFCKGRTVEIGCANGFSTNTMIQHLKSLGRTDVILEGVEPTDWGYAQAVKTYPHIKFTKSMGEQLPFKDGEFDTVLCGEVIEHVLNPEIFLREAARVCKSRLIVTTPSQLHDDPDHKRFYTPVTISKLMAPYCKSPPRIYGLTVDGKTCKEMKDLYFMIVVGERLKK